MRNIKSQQDKVPSEERKKWLSENNRRINQGGKKVR